ncbi:unnamed protein product [Lepidochelys olivacea]
MLLCSPVQLAERRAEWGGEGHGRRRVRPSWPPQTGLPGNQPKPRMTSSKQWREEAGAAGRDLLKTSSRRCLNVFCSSPRSVSSQFIAGTWIPPHSIILASRPSRDTRKSSGPASCFLHLCGRVLYTAAAPVTDS